ncbi:serine/threonine-protein kinase (plasmid) [Sorangium sp. So ce119]|uniref:serine/threonine-protein kinase n=1 Tax=Sorangium sp. So ce119 TaxID=3133279 RepID=UPI003F60E248
MHLGSTIADRFVIERLARRGGMGAVYRGLDRRTGQPVAIKILDEPWDASLARFAPDALILARLDHPRLVRHVAEGVLPSGEPYLVMEWLDGEDLASRLAGGRMRAQDSVALALSIAEALGALHERGIVHRDLKPSNIFLVGGRIDRIKILDLGVVHAEALTRLTATGTPLGTVAYMAPEQALGAKEMDARADVFALGCVLFQCLTGGPPFAAATMAAVLTKILFEVPPRLRDRLPGAPPALDALLARMLSKYPGDRPRNGLTAAAMLRALGDVRVPDVGLRKPEAMSGAPTLARTTAVERSPALTQQAQRGAAVSQNGAPVDARGSQPLVDAALEREAAVHGGALK